MMKNITVTEFRAWLSTLTQFTVKVNKITPDSDYAYALGEIMMRADSPGAPDPPGVTWGWKALDESIMEGDLVEDTPRIIDPYGRITKDGIIKDDGGMYLTSWDISEIIRDVCLRNDKWKDAVASDIPSYRDAPFVVVTVQDGLIQAVHADQPVKIVLKDLDVEGNLEDRITEIGDELAILSIWDATVDADKVKETRWHAHAAAPHMRGGQCPAQAVGFDNSAQLLSIAKKFFEVYEKGEVDGGIDWEDMDNIKEMVDEALSEKTKAAITEAIHAEEGHGPSMS